MLPNSLTLSSFLLLLLSYFFHLLLSSNIPIIAPPKHPIITTDNLITSSLLNSLLSQAEQSFITPATVTSNNQFTVRGAVSDNVNLSCTSFDKSTMIISDRIASFVGVPSYQYISRISVSRFTRPTSRPFSSLLPPHHSHNQTCTHFATAYLYLDDVHIGGESLFRFGSDDMSQTVVIRPKKGRLSVAYMSENINMERATEEVKKGMEIVATFVVMNCKLRSPCKKNEDEITDLKNVPQASQEVLVDTEEHELVVDDEESEEEEEEEEDLIDEYEWSIEEDEDWHEMVDRWSNVTRLSEELIDLRKVGPSPWKSGIAGVQSLVSEL